MTNPLQQSLLKVSIDPVQFSNKFSAWKKLGPAGENDDYYFGKDGFYATPVVDGKMVLRHVHLVPQNDPVGLAQWDRDWAKYRRRSSDNALVYAQDGLYGCLLIATFWSPDAHEIPLMKTKKHRELMNAFAQVADHFVHTGKALV